jgi:MoaA/NifB/PqqE/SkfB family radical SAM enzyme
MFGRSARLSTLMSSEGDDGSGSSDSRRQAALVRRTSPDGVGVSPAMRATRGAGRRELCVTAHSRKHDPSRLAAGPEVAWRGRRAEDPPGKLYLEPTSECNLNCRTCIRNSWDEPGGFMEWHVFERLSRQFAELAPRGTVAFAGLGEPLLHPRFGDMVRLAKQLGLRTEVISNALLLTPELAADLIEAKLDQFVVSIDGTSAESFGDVRSGASLDEVVNNVQLLDDRKANRSLSAMILHSPPSIRIGIEFVAMRRNVDQLPHLQELATKIAATFIVVSNLVPYTEELAEEILYAERLTSATHQGGTDAPRWYFPYIEWNTQTAGPMAEVLKRASLVSMLGADLNASFSQCPFVQEGALAVRWDGAVCPCPPLLHSYRCFVRKRGKAVTRCEFGDLREHSLAEVWEDPEYVAFRARVLDFSFAPCVDCYCGCELAEGNLEDCYGNPFPTCGDCLWARGVIRCA